MNGIELEPKWVRKGCTILAIAFIVAIILMVTMGCNSSQFAHKHRWDNESKRMRHINGSDYFIYNQANNVY